MRDWSRSRGSPTCTSCCWMDTAVTDGALARLEGLAKLRSLYVLDTAITAEAIGSLKAAIPGLRVVSAFKVMASFPDGSILVEDANGDRSFVPLESGEEAAETETDLADGEAAVESGKVADSSDAVDEPEVAAAAQWPIARRPRGLGKAESLGSQVGERKSVG